MSATIYSKFLFAVPLSSCHFEINRCSNFNALQLSVSSPTAMLTQYILMACILASADVLVSACNFVIVFFFFSRLFDDGSEMLWANTGENNGKSERTSHKSRDENMKRLKMLYSLLLIHVTQTIRCTAPKPMRAEVIIICEIVMHVMMLMAFSSASHQLHGRRRFCSWWRTSSVCGLCARFMTNFVKCKIIPFGGKFN